MKETTPKEQVLKNIRDALFNRMQPPFSEVETEKPVYWPPGSEFLEEVFAKALIKADGKFVYCKNVEELAVNFKELIKKINVRKLYYGEDFLTGLLKNLNIDITNNIDDIFTCDAAVTGCETLIARHGTIVCSSKTGGRKSMVAPPVHIVIATNTQLVYSINDALLYLNDKYANDMPSMISFITGPSRTADIEKTLIYGAHGPKELYLLLLDMKLTH